MVGEANAALAEYNGLLQGMVGPGVLLSPLLNQEAVLSSRIEGTQATVEEQFAIGLIERIGVKIPKIHDIIVERLPKVRIEVIKSE